MGWEINANLGLHVSAGGDAHGWLWEITRGAEVARVAIEISERAWSSDPSNVPDDTRQAVETDGRTELLKVLERDDPPRVICCDLDGCTPRRS